MQNHDRAAFCGARRAARLAALAFACLVSVAGTVRAQSAVMRPLPEPPTPTAMEQLAQQTAAQALAAANIHIIDAAEARQRLRQAAENPCLEVNCASSVLRVLDADMLVAVTLASDGEVLVALVDASGKHVNATAPSQVEGVEAATRAAVNRALSKWPARGLVPIVLSGTPVGATVTVDGQPRGTLPLEMRVQPGHHEIVITMDGYLGKRELVELSGAESAPPSLDIALEPELARSSSERGVTVALVAGPTLAVAGAVTMAVALGSLGRAGCEQRARDGVCVERNEVATAPVALWSAAGALALVGGVTWFALGFKRGRHSRTQVGMGWNYVSLQGSF
jgi:PEGA domain